MFGEELHIAFTRIEALIERYPVRGLKGAVGTQLDQLTLLYTMADHIQRARRVDVIFEEAVEGLRRAVGADRAALLLMDRTGKMRFKAWSGLSPAYREAVDGHSPWKPGDSDPTPKHRASAPESGNR